MLLLAWRHNQRVQLCSCTVLIVNKQGIDLHLAWGITAWDAAEHQNRRESCSTHVARCVAAGACRHPRTAHTQPTRMPAACACTQYVVSSHCVRGVGGGGVGERGSGGVGGGWEGGGMGPGVSCCVRGHQAHVLSLVPQVPCFCPRSLVHGISPGRSAAQRDEVGHPVAPHQVLDVLLLKPKWQGQGGVWQLGQGPEVCSLLMYDG